MKYLSTFEGLKYKNGEQYDDKFKYKINDYVKFLDDEPNVSTNTELFQIQSRTDYSNLDYGVKNYYLLSDKNGNTFKWVFEKNISRTDRSKKI